jgi:anion-transporting  ArsA/GET3 family ATPase
MTEVEKEKEAARRPGRPRKYGQGRINATVRFTPERYEELRLEADKNGRSVSEQVEHMVEQAGILRGIVNELRISFSSTHEDNKRLMGELDELKTAHAAVQAELADLLQTTDQLVEVAATRTAKLTKVTVTADELTKIVEAAVTRALAKEHSPTGAAGNNHESGEQS